MRPLSVIAIPLSLNEQHFMNWDNMAPRMTATLNHTRGGQVFLERYTMDRDPKSRIPDWGKAHIPHSADIDRFP